MQCASSRQIRSEIKLCLASKIIIARCSLDRWVGAVVSGSDDGSIDRSTEPNNEEDEREIETMTLFRERAALLVSRRSVTSPIRGWRRKRRRSVYARTSPFIVNIGHRCRRWKRRTNIKGIERINQLPTTKRRQRPCRPARWYVPVTFRANSIIDTPREGRCLVVGCDGASRHRGNAYGDWRRQGRIRAGENRGKSGRESLREKRRIISRPRLSFSAWFPGQKMVNRFTPRTEMRLRGQRVAIFFFFFSFLSFSFYARCFALEHQRLVRSFVRSPLILVRSLRRSTGNFSSENSEVSLIAGQVAPVTLVNPCS